MTALIQEIISKDEIERNLESFEFAIDQTVERALEFNVCSMWAAEEAINLVAKVKGYFKKIEEMRKQINEPFRRQMAINNERVKPFTDKLEQIEKILKGKIEIWKKKRQEEEKQKEQEAKLMQDALQLDVTPYMTIQTEVRTSEALTYEKTEWKFEVECLALIPINYICVDEEKVKAMLKAGIREIPGLRIYEEKKTIIRSR